MRVISLFYPCLVVSACLALAFSQEPQADETLGKKEISSADQIFEKARGLLHGTDGGSPEPEKAFELFNQAAELGHPDSLGAVGYFYSEGIIVEKNDAVAFWWFEQGAHRGSAKSAFNLANFYVEGRGVEPTPQAAFYYFSIAAENGMAEAHASMADFLLFGIHGTVDQELALKHARIAAEAGVPQAWNLLGVIYENGLGATADLSKAEGCFRKAAIAGNAKGQTNLGLLLDPRSDDKSKRSEAISWLVSAESKGEPVATKLLQELSNEKFGPEVAAARLRDLSPPARSGTGD